MRWKRNFHSYSNRLRTIWCENVYSKKQITKAKICVCTFFIFHWTEKFSASVDCTMNIIFHGRTNGLMNVFPSIILIWYFFRSFLAIRCTQIRFTLTSTLINSCFSYYWHYIEIKIKKTPKQQQKKNLSETIKNNKSDGNKQMWIQNRTKAPLISMTMFSPKRTLVRRSELEYFSSAEKRWKAREFRNQKKWIPLNRVMT